MTRQQLTDAANELAETVLPPGQLDPISERTIRFWASEGLLPRSGGPRKAARYAPELVYQCVLVRRLQKLDLLSLKQIRDVLGALDSESIEQIVKTNEPIEIANEMSEADLHHRMDKGEKVIPLKHDQPKPRDRRPQKSDRPRNLNLAPDLEKVRAIEAAMAEVGITGDGLELAPVSYSLDIVSISYDRLERGSFRQPARLDIVVQSVGNKDADDRFRDFRRVRDVDLCKAIAGQLGSMTGEPYLIEILSKRYPDPERSRMRSRLSVTLLIARDLSEES